MKNKADEKPSAFDTVNGLFDKAADLLGLSDACGLRKFSYERRGGSMSIIGLAQGRIEGGDWADFAPRQAVLLV